MHRIAEKKNFVIPHEAMIEEIEFQLYCAQKAAEKKQQPEEAEQQS